jgi:4-hydroxy-tetrahydrodipicolinate synthase
MSDALRLHGIITALVTPFSAAGGVDEAALNEIIEFQVKSRVNGLFPLGTTGMGPAMEPDERKQVAEIVVERVKSRIPVIIQVGAADPLTSLDLARHAERIGADAVACLNPFYYHPAAESIIEHYRRLSGGTKLPILAYNIPSNTGNNIDAKLLLELSKIPRVVGIKDSSRDFMQLQDYLATVPESFTVINGADAYLFSAFCAGVKAGVSATANAFPDLYVEMYEAYKSGDFEKGKTLQSKIFVLRKATVTPAIAPLLEVLRMRGVRSGSVRAPLRELTPEEVRDLRAAVSRILPELKVVA